MLAARMISECDTRWPLVSASSPPMPANTGRCVPLNVTRNLFYPFLWTLEDLFSHAQNWWGNVLFVFLVLLYRHPGLPIKASCQHEIGQDQSVIGTTAQTQDRLSEAVWVTFRGLCSWSLHGHWLGMGTTDLAPILHVPERASD